jgi:hypothetical protein
MIRNARRATTSTKRKRPVEEPTLIPPEAVEKVEIAVDPTLQARYNILKEKRLECEELEKLTEASGNMTVYISELCQTIDSLAGGVERASGTLGNWDVIFGVMGEMNRAQDELNAQWVRFSKSVTNESSSHNDQAMPAPERNRRLA